MRTVKSLPLKASAEAVFGSCARGDSDKFSDRDALIVDDDIKVLRARAIALKSEGYSVASYTFRKLECLSEVGALFLQHLKLEAAITTDSNDRLAGVLKNYQPKIHYRDELNANSKLAGIISSVPAGALSELWAADVLYVTVRNFGVLWLAGRGKYVFSYERIIESLRDAGVLDANAASALGKLRFLKGLYRSGEIASPGRVISKVSEALMGLPAKHFPNALEVVSANDVLFAAAPPSDSSAYLVLRDLEKRVLAAQSIVGMEFNDDSINSLRGWIHDPRIYANLSASMAPQLRATLNSYATGLRKSGTNG